LRPDFLFVDKELVFRFIMVIIHTFNEDGYFIELIANFIEVDFI
jgi:hypothetical protein